MFKLFAKFIAKFKYEFFKKANPHKKHIFKLHTDNTDNEYLHFTCKVKHCPEIWAVHKEYLYGQMRS